MVSDHLSRQSLYRSLHPRFAAGFDWLRTFDPQLAEGKYPIAGDDVFALVQSYRTCPPPEKLFETHRERIDIQYLAAGTERMLWTAAEGLRVCAPYDAARDVMFYAEPAACSSLVCGPGSFAIFFPDDAHKPGCAWEAPAMVRKVVLKIRL